MMAAPWLQSVRGWLQTERSGDDTAGLPSVPAKRAQASPQMLLVPPQSGARMSSARLPSGS